MNNSFTRLIFNKSETTRHHREERVLSSWLVSRVLRKTIIVVALGCPSLTSTTAYADNGQLTDCSSANGCLFSALTGLVNGFTGAAGSQLWGWMLGGGQSAGVANIQSELESIESTLTTIENELGPTGPIVQQLEKLQCAEDSSWINSGPATVINSWYARYSNFLTAMQNGSDIPLGTISTSNTDLTTLYGWANGVIQGNVNVAPTDALTAMIELNNLSTSGTSAGTIADCIVSNGNAPAQGTLDDRPYYTDNVQPIQYYLLNLNAQAMIVLTEAYHVDAYGACLTANGGDTSQCASSSTDDVIPNLCPSGNASSNCVTPIVIYGSLGSTASGQFLPYTQVQFKTGGAPYSSDDILMANGTDELMTVSIEAYNTASGANYPDPATALCGPTVLYPTEETLPSVAVGPYGYGSGAGNGVWTSASASLFEALLDNGYNNANGGNPAVSAADYLCTMSATGGDLSTCTQAPLSAGSKSNGGMGLKNLAVKGIYFPEQFGWNANQDNINWEGTFCFQCFLDGNLEASTTGQPLCNQNRFDTILPITTVYGEPCGLQFSMSNPPGLSTMGTFENFYVALWCQYDSTWTTVPDYLVPPIPNQSFTWPSLDWTALTCSNGKAPNDPSNLNPAGVPSLCGNDFKIWFSA
jgi:hypothetical protein